MNFRNLWTLFPEYPREIEFVDELPMTTTGKIMRKELKKLEIKRKSGNAR